MKQRNVEILKKNTVFYKAKMYDENWEKSWDFKLKIDEKSENLDLGRHVLLLDDVSVVTKYGTDVIYKVHSEITDPNKICTFKHHLFNQKILKKCKYLGGKWDSSEKVWVFNELVEEQVEILENLYNENLTIVDIIAKEDISDQPEVTFLGYPLIRAMGRDSGAMLCDEIIKISGQIQSGGSMKNWLAIVREGATFRLKISKNLLKAAEEQEHQDLKLFDVKIIQKSS